MRKRNRTFFFEKIHNHLVDALSDEFFKLIGQILIHRTLANECSRIVGAPPVEVVAAFAPVASFPFTNERHDVSVVFGVLLQTQRHLPAHVWFPVHRPFAGFERRDMERTSHAAGEVGFVVKDARAVDTPRDVGSIAFFGEPTTIGALCVILPMLRLEAFYRFSNGREVLLIDEMRPITATALLQCCRIIVQNPLAAISVDALPIGAEERGVHQPRLIFFRIGK